MKSHYRYYPNGCLKLRSLKKHRVEPGSTKQKLQMKKKQRYQQ